MNRRDEYYDRERNRRKPAGERYNRSGREDSTETVRRRDGAVNRQGSDDRREIRRPQTGKRGYGAAQQRYGRNVRRRKKSTGGIIALMIIIAVVIIAVIVIAVSCSKKNKGNQAATEIPAPETVAQEEDRGATPEEVTVAAADVVNIKPINLYTMDYNSMTCNKVKEINKAWTIAEDLEAFGAFATSEDSFSFTSETQAHNDTWNSISTETVYKIGYELSFDVDGEHKVITILEPGDIETNPDLYCGDYPEDGDYSRITGYMGVWVYDDMHQDGNYYIHITQAEVTEDTLLTSIKLRPTPQSEYISNLVLKGFSYSSEEEFGTDGHYIGNYAASVVINK